MEFLEPTNFEHFRTYMATQNQIYAVDGFDE